MERASRRSAAAQSTRDASDNSSSLRHRRRRDTGALAGRASSNTSASQSDDGAETDSSSVAPQDAGNGSATRRANKKLLPARDAKKRGVQRDENPADERGADDADGDDELDEEENEQSGTESRDAASSANGKRDRSMSNVSTTSSSSSVASDHDEDDREAVHVEKLKELEKKKKMVEDGTLAEFCRRVTEFKEERNQLLETAEWHKDLQLKNSQDLYGFEAQRAHNLFQQGKDALKSDLLQQVDALVVKLKQELAGLSKADATDGVTADAKDSAQSPSSSLPSDSTEQEDAVSEQEEKIRTKGALTFVPSSHVIATSTHSHSLFVVHGLPQRLSQPSGEKSAVPSSKRPQCACHWTRSAPTSLASWASERTTRRSPRRSRTRRRPV